MRNKQIHFWTEEKQAELLKEYDDPKRKLNDTQLAKKWGKNLTQMYTVISFARQKILCMSETIIEDGVKITKFKAGYAQGIIPQKSVNFHKGA